MQMGAIGGSAALNVNTGTGCLWTASTNVGWIHINSASGSGSGTVSFSVDANTGSQREGLISIGQSSVLVIQSAAQSTSLRPGARILTHIAAGAEWTTTIYLTNLNTVLSEVYSLDFFKQNGGAWPLALNGGAPVLGTGGSLGPGKTLVLTTSSFGPLDVGWAAVYGGPNIAGFAVFRSVSASGNIQEAASPIVSQLQKRYVMLYSAKFDVDSGIAVVNPTASPLIITVRFTPFNAQVPQVHVIDLPPFGHKSMSAIGAFTWAFNTEGTMELTANSGFALLGLRFTIRGSSFTSFEPFYPFGTAR
jgi:hypothetical protein